MLPVYSGQPEHLNLVHVEELLLVIALSPGHLAKAKRSKMTKYFGIKHTQSQEAKQLYCANSDMFLHSSFGGRRQCPA